MKNPFEGFFASTSTEVPKTDSAAHTAIPESGGVDDRDLSFEHNPQAEIEKIEKEIKQAEESGYGDVAFLKAKLQAFKDSIENTTE